MRWYIEKLIYRSFANLLLLMLYLMLPVFLVATPIAFTFKVWAENSFKPLNYIFVTLFFSLAATLVPFAIILEIMFSDSRLYKFINNYGNACENIAKKVFL